MMAIIHHGDTEDTEKTKTSFTRLPSSSFSDPLHYMPSP